MTGSEKINLIRMLPAMTKFIMETGGKSLISRIYGLYMVEYPGISPIYLMLQKNNIQLQKKNELLSTFDLKGSKFNRQVIFEDEKRDWVDQNVSGFSHLNKSNKDDKVRFQT